MSSYSIIKQVSSTSDAFGNSTQCPAHKFCCLVSFNNKPEQYYEVESLNAEEINAILEKVAAEDFANSAVKDEQGLLKDALVIDEGRLVSTKE